jgi:hypothetical protein
MVQKFTLSVMKKNSSEFKKKIEFESAVIEIEHKFRKHDNRPFRFSIKFAEIVVFK